MNALTIFLAIGACATGAVGIGVVTRAIFRLVIRLNDVWELLHRELTPNGGNSMNDRVREMNHTLRNQELLLRLHIEDAKAHYHAQAS